MWNPFNNLFPKKEVVDVTGMTAFEADAVVKSNPSATHVFIDGHIFPIKKAEGGDGKAEFIGEGTTEEFEEQEKKDKGQHGIFGIGL